MNKLQNTLKYFRIERETFESRRIAETQEGQGPFTTKKWGKGFVISPDTVLSGVDFLAC